MQQGMCIVICQKELWQGAGVSQYRRPWVIGLRKYSRAQKGLPIAIEVRQGTAGVPIAVGQAVDRSDKLWQKRYSKSQGVSQYRRPWVEGQRRYYGRAQGGACCRRQGLRSEEVRQGTRGLPVAIG